MHQKKLHFLLREATQKSILKMIIEKREVRFIPIACIKGYKDAKNILLIVNCMKHLEFTFSI